MADIPTTQQLEVWEARRKRGPLTEDQMRKRRLQLEAHFRAGQAVRDQNWRREPTNLRWPSIPRLARRHPDLMLAFKRGDAQAARKVIEWDSLQVDADGLMTEYTRLYAKYTQLYGREYQSYVPTLRQMHVWMFRHWRSQLSVRILNENAEEESALMAEKQESQLIVVHKCFGACLTEQQKETRRKQLTHYFE